MHDYTPWRGPRITIAPSRIQGRDLFAREPIAEGKIVVRAGGEMLTSGDSPRIATLQHTNTLAFDDDLHLLIADDSPTNCGNHSCDANLWMMDAVTLCHPAASIWTAGGSRAVERA